MSKVMTFSRYFPAYHPRKGEPTYFVEQIQNSLISMNWEIDLYKDINPPMKFLESLTKENVGYKHHTIRAGNRWKVGDKFSPRVWSGKPYNSKQIIIAPDIEVKKVFKFTLLGGVAFIDRGDFMNDDQLTQLANNDGLSLYDFVWWFKNFSYHFEGQIICWNETITY